MKWLEKKSARKGRRETRRANTREAYPGAIEKRYGEDPCAQAAVSTLGAMSLEEVGTILGLGKERVRQLEERALRRMRINAESMGIADELESELSERVSLAARRAFVYPEPVGFEDQSTKPTTRHLTLVKGKAMDEAHERTDRDQEQESQPGC